MKSKKAAARPKAAARAKAAAKPKTAAKPSPEPEWKEPEIKRNCLAAGVAEDACGVLVVSTDDDQSELSAIFELADFMAGPVEVTFSKPEWFTGMWMSPAGRYYLSEALGSCLTNVSGKLVRARVSSEPLTGIWGLDPHAVYAFGRAGCFRFDGKKWTALAGAPRDVYGTHGRSERELLVVGKGGTLARYDGARWHRVPVPSGVRLLCVHVVDERTAYVAGEEGACFRLRGDTLERITAPDVDLHAIAAWRGGVYFGSLERGTFELAGKKLVPNREQGKRLIPAGHFAASERFLYAAGGNMFSRFDGKEWKARPFT